LIVTIGVLDVYVETLDNGVQRVKIHRDGFNKKQTKDIEAAASHGSGYADDTYLGKTLFPESWDEAKIRQAIEHVVRNPGSEVIPTRGNQTKYRGVYDGVRMDVQFAGDDLTSAYPTWSQP